MQNSNNNKALKPTINITKELQIIFNKVKSNDEETHEQYGTYFLWVLSQLKNLNDEKDLFNEFGITFDVPVKDVYTEQLVYSQDIERVLKSIISLLESEQLEERIQSKNNDFLSLTLLKNYLYNFLTPFKQNQHNDTTLSGKEGSEESYSTYSAEDTDEDADSLNSGSEEIGDINDNYTAEDTNVMTSPTIIIKASNIKNATLQTEEFNQPKKPNLLDTFKDQLTKLLNNLKKPFIKNTFSIEDNFNEKDVISNDDDYSESMHDAKTVKPPLNKNINPNINKNIPNGIIKVAKPQEEFPNINSSKVDQSLLELVSMELRDASINNYTLTPIHDPINDNSTIEITLCEAREFLKAANLMVQHHGIENVDLKPNHINNLFKEYINTDDDQEIETQLKRSLLSELNKYFTLEKSQLNTNNLSEFTHKSVFTDNIQQARTSQRGYSSGKKVPTPDDQITRL